MAPVDLTTLMAQVWTGGGKEPKGQMAVSSFIVAMQDLWKYARYTATPYAGEPFPDGSMPGSLASFAYIMEQNCDRGDVGRSYGYIMSSYGYQLDKWNKDEITELFRVTERALSQAAVLALAGIPNAQEDFVRRLIIPCVKICYHLVSDQLVQSGDEWPGLVEIAVWRHAAQHERIFRCWGERRERHGGPRIIRIEVQIARVLAGYLEALRVGSGRDRINELEVKAGSEIFQIGPLCKENSSLWWKAAKPVFKQLLGDNYEDAACFAKYQKSPQFNKPRKSYLSDGARRYEIRGAIDRAMWRAFKIIAPEIMLSGRNLF
jgi:hypothetical protein